MSKRLFRVLHNETRPDERLFEEPRSR